MYHDSYYKKTFLMPIIQEISLFALAIAAKTPQRRVKTILCKIKVYNFISKVFPMKIFTLFKYLLLEELPYNNSYLPGIKMNESLASSNE